MSHQRLPTAGLGPDTGRRFKVGNRARHKDTGIQGRIVAVWRFHDRDSGADGRDYVRMRWPGSIETDERPASLEPWAT
jgi:hypothetical protein